MKRLFPLGLIVATPGALEVIGVDSQAIGRILLEQHASGNWGDLDAGDRLANNAAVNSYERILSAYIVNGTRIWIITEADRSSTCILLPEED